jgi:hypothetical protein
MLCVLIMIRAKCAVINFAYIVYAAKYTFYFLVLVQELFSLHIIIHRKKIINQYMMQRPRLNRILASHLIPFISWFFNSGSMLLNLAGKMGKQKHNYAAV